MKVCMFVRNPVSGDPRVKNEAMALSRAGYKVTIVGKAESGFPAREEWEGISIIRVSYCGRKVVKLLRATQYWVRALKAREAGHVREETPRPRHGGSRRSRGS